MNSMNRRRQAGMTLVELMIVLIVTSVVLVLLGSLLSSTTRQGRNTTWRADAQGGARQALTLMTTELRQAGTDPGNPPIGVVGVLSADSTSVHIQADLDGDGVIETAEPSEDVTYAFSSVAQMLTRNPGGGAASLLPNVTAARFTYYDDTNAVIVPLPLSAADAARVKSIGITFTVSEHGSPPVTMTSRVNLRNR